MNMEKRAEEIQYEIVKWRRDLHMIPEIGNNLPKTSKYIQDELNRLEVEYLTCVNGSGIVALIGKEKDGKVIALRADTDGLPMKEETGLEYASINECMHACGHDAHAAVALGVAKILKENEEALKGRVKILFQPGEELLLGAKAMIEEGVLENPKVDYMIAMHTGSVPGLPNGSVITMNGVVSASSDSFIIKVLGKGGHAAYPETCIDPIISTANIINSMQSIITREIQATKAAVITISGVKAGNESFNIIPDYAEIRGTFRTQSKEVRDYIANRIKEVSEAICSAMGTKCEVEILRGVPSVYNDKKVVDVLSTTYESMENRKVFLNNMPAQMGSEDAALFFEKVPGAYILFTTTKECCGKEYPSHNPKYDVDDESLYIAAGLMSKTIVNLMK